MTDSIRLEIARLCSQYSIHERVNGLLPPLHAPFDGVAGDFRRISAALATGAMSKWRHANDVVNVGGSNE